MTRDEGIVGAAEGEKEGRIEREKERGDVGTVTGSRGTGISDHIVHLNRDQGLLIGYAACIFACLISFFLNLGKENCQLRDIVH